MSQVAAKGYIVPATGGYTHTIILLHGRDSVAEEFATKLFESQTADDRTLPKTFPSVKWVFPSSNMRKSARFDTELSRGSTSGL